MTHSYDRFLVKDFQGASLQQVLDASPAALKDLSAADARALDAALGISHTMLNAFLYSVFGQFDAQLRAISLEGPLLSFRNAFLDRLAQGNPVQAVIAVGNGAQHTVQHWPGGQDLPVFEITHPAAHDESALLANWNQSLSGLRAVVDPDDDGQAGAALYGASFQPQDQVPIPRHDLPFGLPDWHGNGSHGARQGDQEIVWIAP